jgi:DNA polymerase-3 subunit beta
MKISIQKSVLENILISSQPFLEKKDTSQITSHVLVKVENSTLSLKATDYEIGLHVKVELSHVTQEGEFTANGKKFLDIIKILKDKEITLETKNDTLHITQGNSNFKLPTFISNEFPVFPNYEGKAKISIESHTLIESLRKITSAIDTNNPKFELNGALIDIKNSSLSFVATDTRRLALVTIENSSQYELSLIIPKKAIIEIQKLFFNNIEIYYDNTYIIIHSEQYTFFTKLINGKFPDYTRIIPKELSTTIVLPKSNIIDSIKQITTISNDMKITLHNDNILFESLSNDNIEAKTEITHETGFREPFVLAVNSRYILDFLSQIDDPEFTINLNASNLPFVLEDKNFKTIVMPIVI